MSDQNGNAKHAGKQFAIVQAMWSYGGRDFCVIDGQIYQRASDNTWQVVWRVGAPTYSRVQGRDGQWYAINTSDPNDVRLLEDDPDEKSSPH